MFNNVIETYQPLLRRVQQHIPTAVLAGGCLRDTFYGVEVKDADFVVEAIDRMLYPLTPASRWLRDVFPGVRFRWCVDEVIAEYAQEPNPSGLLDVIESEDGTINFIIVRNIKQYTNHFPDSISEMVFDGEQVHVSNRWRDGNAARFVYYNEDIQEQRLAKLMRKYPNHIFLRRPAAQQPQLREQDLIEVIDALEW